jgi:peptide/nickel transport system substrate-binding protein
VARIDLPMSGSGAGRWTRRGLIRGTTGLAVALSVPAALAGCASSQTQAPTAAPVASPDRPSATQAPSAVGQARRGGTLRIAFPGSPKRLDPAIMTVNEEYNATLAMYNNLVRVDPKLQTRPELATSWQPSDDLKTWTFKLRQGVKFHHGKAFTADDVVFTYKRLLDPDTASSARSILGFVDGAEKTADDTVVFHLNQANADLPTILGFAQGRILPADRSADQIAKEPSGTGPFKYKEWVQGERISFIRNEDYWEQGLPYVDEVRLVAMPEQASRDAALTAGTVDMIWQLNPEEKPTLEAVPGVSVLEIESGGYQPIVMRADKPPFDNLKLRQAMKYVADRPQMRQAVLLGLGSLGTDHPIPPVNPFYTDIGIRGRDLVKAKQLLNDAGYPDGIDLTLYTTDGRPGLVEQAVAYKEMAAPAGIRVNVQKVPNNVFWADYWLKKDFITSNWNFRPTADESLTVVHHSKAAWNESHWTSPKLDELIEKARAERDTTKRKAIYADAERLLQDEGPVVIAFFRPMLSALRESVRGFEIHPATWMDVRATWLES